MRDKYKEPPIPADRAAKLEAALARHLAAPLDDEEVAMMQVTAARMALTSAIEAFQKAGYGSHVTNPLRDALRFVEFSISEVKS